MPRLCPAQLGFLIRRLRPSSLSSDARARAALSRSYPSRLPSGTAQHGVDDLRRVRADVSCSGGDRDLTSNGGRTWCVRCAPSRGSAVSTSCAGPERRLGSQTVSRTSLQPGRARPRMPRHGGEEPDDAPSSTDPAASSACKHPVISAPRSTSCRADGAVEDGASDSQLALFDSPRPVLLQRDHGCCDGERSLARARASSGSGWPSTPSRYDSGRAAVTPGIRVNELLRQARHCRGPGKHVSYRGRGRYWALSTTSPEAREGLGLGRVESQSATARGHIEQRTDDGAANVAAASVLARR